MNAQPPRTSGVAVPAEAGPARNRRLRRRPLPRRALALVAVALPVVLGGCQMPTFWGYRGSTTQAHDEFNLYAGTFLAAIVVGVITAGLILWSVIRYRRRSDEMPRQFQYHIPLEITYTIIPIIIVLVLFAFTFVTENKVDALSKPTLKVKITAFQWGWKFDYQNQHVYVEGAQRQDPDPVGSDGVLDSCTRTAKNADYCLGPGLVLPVGETVQIQLVSADVIHGFYVPEFNFSRYAQPGVPLQFFDLDIKKTGVYRGQCTQLCGLYHSQMFFHVVAVTPSQFQAWVNGSQPTPDSSSVPNTNGSGANNNLPPAYPSGSHAGSVVYPTPSTTTSTTTSTTSTTSPSTSSTTTSSTTTSTKPTGTAP